MNTINDLNKRKTPIVTIDKSLEKFIDMPLFQDKVDKANAVLKNIGLPNSLKAKRK